MSTARSGMRRGRCPMRPMQCAERETQIRPYFRSTKAVMPEWLVPGGRDAPRTFASLGQSERRQETLFPLYLFGPSSLHHHRPSFAEPSPSQSGQEAYTG